MVIHEFKLLGQLNGLIKGHIFSGASLYPGSSVFDSLFKLGITVLFLVKVHVLLSLDEGSNELATGLTHDF